MKNKIQNYIDKYKGKKFWMDCCFAKVTDIVSPNNGENIYVRLHAKNGIYSLDIKSFKKILRLNGYEGE